MAFRHPFLIDECLSPKLAEVGAGFADVTHVNFRGLRQQPDTAVVRWCVAHDHVAATNNGRDFRQLYAAIDLHPGVVILLSSISRAHQCAIFAAALPMLVARSDLASTMIEMGSDGGLTFTDLPPGP